MTVAHTLVSYYFLYLFKKCIGCGIIRALDWLVFTDSSEQVQIMGFAFTKL